MEDTHVLAAPLCAMMPLAAGDDAEKSRRVIEQRNITYPQLLNTGNQYSEAYGILGLPYAIIYEKMNQADMLVIASPVYFYSISAQLKAVIDRFHNPIRDTFHIKSMALLLVGAATLPELFDAILTEYNLCLKFFSIEDAGKVLVRGIKDKGDIMGTSFLEDAYQLGTSI